MQLIFIHQKILKIFLYLKDNQPCTKFDLKDLGTFEVWGFGFHMASNASLAILAAFKWIWCWNY